MPGNRSLDEFAADDEPADEAGDPAFEPAAAATPEAVDDSVEDDVEPVAETFAWSPDGGDCAACGETVDERWRDGNDLVCADCKAW